MSRVVLMQSSDLSAQVSQCRITISDNYTGPVAVGYRENFAYPYMYLKGDTRSTVTASEEIYYSGSGRWQPASPTVRYVSTKDITEYSLIMTKPLGNVIGAYALEEAEDWVSLEDEAKEYFDNYVPGRGIGNVTLQTKPPSQRLTFTSQRLGTSITQWVRGNTLIAFPVPQTGPVTWEVMFRFRISSYSGIMLINSNFEVTYKMSLTEDVVGEILKYDHTTQKVIAVHEGTTWAYYGYMNSDDVTTPGSYAQNADIVTQWHYARNGQFIIGQTSATSYIPYELGLSWIYASNSSMQMCIVKYNTSTNNYDITKWIAAELVGSSMRMKTNYSNYYWNGITRVSSFAGRIKYFDYTSGSDGEWHEIGSSDSTEHVINNGIAFGIPS